MSADPRYLDDGLCCVYREANLRFPQVEIGIVPLVGNFMLQRGADYLTDALSLDFSPAQVEAIRDGMNSAHGARRIPALSPDSLATRGIVVGARPPESMDGIRVITDERIRAVWRNIVFYTIDAMVDCILLVRPDLALPQSSTADCYSALSKALPAAFAADPHLLGQVSAMFETAVRALESEEARRIARDFRAALDFRDVQKGRRALLESRQVLHQVLGDLLLRYLSAEHAAFAPLIETRSWRIFRPMMSA